MVSPGLADVCRQFEGWLLRSLWPQSSSVTAATDENGEFLSPAAGSQRELINGLLAQAFADAMETAGGVGLGRQLARTLSGLQR